MTEEERERREEAAKNCSICGKPLGSYLRHVAKVREHTICVERRQHQNEVFKLRQEIEKKDREITDLSFKVVRLNEELARYR